MGEKDEPEYRFSGIISWDWDGVTYIDERVTQMMGGEMTFQDWIRDIHEGDTVEITVRLLKPKAEGHKGEGA